MIIMKSLQEREKQTLEDMARAIPKDSPLRGPNGNVIVYVDWKSTQGEKWSNWEGGIVSARVSDWGNAETCHSCGRSIVHVFYVYNIKDDKVYAYGQNHAHLALGYDKPLGKRKLKDIEIEVKNFNKSKDIIKKEIDEQLSGTWEGIRENAISRGFKLSMFNQEGLDLYWDYKRKEGIIYLKNWTGDIFFAAIYDLGLILIRLDNLGDLMLFLEKNGR